MPDNLNFHLYVNKKNLHILEILQTSLYTPSTSLAVLNNDNLL